LGEIDFQMDKNSNNKFTPLGSLGEFGLIEHLTNNLKMIHKSTIKGVGDDAAVLDYGSKYIVLTTDLLTEGVHFNLIYTPLRHLGYKAVIVNLSDIYAMNAVPRQITVSLTISAKFSLEHIEELYSGIRLACDKYGVDLVGGDTTSSLTGLTISISAIGEVDKEKVVFRSGAKVNDLICVSGNLGAAYMGLQLLVREKNLFESKSTDKPDFGTYSYILERQLKPEAGKNIIEMFRETEIIPNAMIDISDGLSSELLHICKSSGTGCSIYQEKIPIDDETYRMAEEFNIPALTAALNGGEDYELLFTIPLDKYDLISKRTEVHIVGHITEKSKGCRLILNNGSDAEITAQGWNALK
jgi:thiamine-monophosphate kinase